MPSVATAWASAVLLSTQLWPMAVLGMEPVCLRVTLKVLQLLLTSITWVSKVIWSVEPTSTAHSAAKTGRLARPSAEATTSLRNIDSLLFRAVDSLQTATGDAGFPWVAATGHRSTGRPTDPRQPSSQAASKDLDGA